jgi:hypothetical protein
MSVIDEICALPNDCSASDLACVVLRAHARGEDIPRRAIDKALAILEEALQGPPPSLSQRLIF